jgi:hypothetical protein
LTALVRAAAFIRRQEHALVEFERAMLLAGALGLSTTIGVQLARRATTQQCGPVGPYQRAGPY